MSLDRYPQIDFLDGQGCAATAASAPTGAEEEEADGSAASSGDEEGDSEDVDSDEEEDSVLLGLRGVDGSIATPTGAPSSSGKSSLQARVMEAGEDDEEDEDSSDEESEETHGDEVLTPVVSSNRGPDEISGVKDVLSTDRLPSEDGNDDDAAASSGISESSCSDNEDEGHYNSRVSGKNNGGKQLNKQAADFDLEGNISFDSVFPSKGKQPQKLTSVSAVSKVSSLSSIGATLNSNAQKTQHVSAIGSLHKSTKHKQSLSSSSHPYKKFKRN